MTSPIYSWFYEDPFHSAFLAVTASLSVASNSLLLYIIATTTSASIGPYRWLLAVFAICDIMTSAGHAAFQPVSSHRNREKEFENLINLVQNMHMTTSGFYFFPRHGEMMIGGCTCFLLLLFDFMIEFQVHSTRSLLWCSSLRTIRRFSCLRITTCTDTRPLRGQFEMK